MFSSKNITTITTTSNLTFTLGKYLSSGGYGTVWSCRSDDGIEAVAKFEKKPSLLFEREVYLKLPNSSYIPKFYGYGNNFIVIERFQDTMSEWLEYNGFSANNFVLESICRSLKHLHENGYTHNDIKGANVLISKDERAVLSDFGNCVDLKACSFKDRQAAIQSDLDSLAFNMIEWVSGIEIHSFRVDTMIEEAITAKDAAKLSNVIEDYYDEEFPQLREFFEIAFSPFSSETHDKLISVFER